MLKCNMVLDLVIGLFWLFLVAKRRAERAQELLLVQLERFLIELADQYARCADLREALEQSAHSCEGRLRCEVLELADALERDLSDDGVVSAKQTKNAYMLLLFSLCHTIRVYGDMQVAGVSLFIYNIRYIKEEVRIELLRRQEGRYAFLGLIPLAVLPFFVCIPIQAWSHSVSASLDRFYVGTYGFVTLMVCFWLTVICAVAVQELQYPVMAEDIRQTLAQRLLRIPIVSSLIDRRIALHYSRYLRKNEQLKILQGYGNIREFLVKKILGMAVCVGMSCGLLIGYRVVWLSQRMDAGTHAAGIGTGCILVGAAAAIGYFLPDARVMILRARVEYQKMEETLRFETLILIVMHYSRITVEELLRWMEQFSVVFSRALQRAVDDFSYHRRESLIQLKCDLGYEPARKLVDALMVCDDIPVAQAFYDVEGERAYNMESFKQRALDLQREKAAFARVIAFLPFVSVLVLRLVVPFVLEGLMQLSQY